jgi:hypothetical protein
MKNTWLALTWIVLLPTFAIAQRVPLDCPPPLENDIGAKGLAGGWFSRAAQLAKGGKQAEALGAYACSYRFVQHPNTLYNMGQTAFLSGDAALAEQLLKQYVTENPTGQYADMASARLGEIQRQKPLSVAAAPPLPPTAPPSEPELVPPATPPAAEPRPAAVKVKLPVAPGASSDPKKPRTFRILGWGGIGLGGATLIVASILEGVANAKIDEAQKTTSLEDFDKLNEAGRNLQIGATTLFVTTGVAVAAGTALLILDAYGKNESVVASLTPGGVIVRGRF